MTSFFRETSNPSPQALMVFDYLGIFSLFSILKMYRKLGIIQIFYLTASPLGLVMVRTLIFFKVILDNPTQIKDLLMFDTPHTKACGSYSSGFKISHANQEIIEEAVAIFFSELSKNSKDLLVAGVKSTWIYFVAEILWLQAFAEQKANKLKVSSDQIVVVSRYASLVNALKSISPNLFPPSSVPVIQQVFQNNVIPLFYRSLFWSLQSLLFLLFAWGKWVKPKLKINNPLPKISFAAIWGIKLGQKTSLLHDLFWWRKCGISSKRLAYIYDRPNYQPTTEKIRITESLGIQSFVSHFRFTGNYPHLLLENIVPFSFRVSMKEILPIFKRYFRAMFLEPLPQSTIAISNLHFIRSVHLASYFKALNIRGVIHYQQTAADIYSLAAELSGACRFGFLWSCIHFYADVLATTQMTFVWGKNDAMLQIESGCISKHMLIAGCLVDKVTEEKIQKKYLATIEMIRCQGANYFLALFPSSTLAKDFYSYFFNWVIEDPELGLIIKPKGHLWVDVQNDGLNGLVQKALKTGRVQIVDSTVSPADISEVVDFSIGIGSYSAVVVSALRGSRILFVDYEKYQGQNKQPFNLLHSLGPYRCVFPSFTSLKKALLEYFQNPENNPQLGDASSVLDLFDPFQDGRANERIGEYMKWYFEGLDSGLNKDDSLKNATKNYAKKWGADKVVLGLD